MLGRSGPGNGYFRRRASTAIGRRAGHGAITCTIQELFGHKDVSTTRIYTHVLNRGGRGDRSPLDIAFPRRVEPSDAPLSGPDRKPWRGRR
jgi:integrase